MVLRSRLAALLHADVVGSTELVQLDERLAHERIQAAFRRFSELISQYGGVTHEIRGDALIAEFSRASDALSAALAFQNSNVMHYETLPDEIRPRLRIGIALGEVIAADETITGAGVVLAQRLEQLSNPDGVVLHGAVFETIPRRFPFDYEPLGELSLKGFDELTRGYIATLRPGAEIPRPEGPAGNADDVDSSDTSVHGAIAVLPFENLSNDPDQEYFADGLTEDVITALSHCRVFPVIARNSTFTFKGVAVRVQEAAQDLGARYVLEGSVRKSGSRVRVTAKLIDATSGHHLWAEKYDRALEDVFSLQDELTAKIASIVEPELSQAELDRSLRKAPMDLLAWDYFLRGMSCLNRYTSGDYAMARKMFQKAIDLEPTYGEAWAGLGWALTRELSLIPPESRQPLLDKAVAAAREAVRLDEGSAVAHYVLATANVWADNIQLGISQLERCLQLNPYFSQAYMALGNRLDLTGRTEEGIQRMESSLELNPRDPTRATYMAYLSRAYASKGEFEVALSWIEKAVSLRPEDPDLRYRQAVCLANVDAVSEAKAALSKCEKLQPGLTSARASWRPYPDEQRNERFFSGLRRHGLTGKARAR